MASGKSSNPLVGFVSATIGLIFAATVFFYFVEGGAVNAEDLGDVIVGYFEWIINLAKRLAGLARTHMPQG